MEGRSGEQELGGGEEAPFSSPSSSTTHANFPLPSSFHPLLFTTFVQLPPSPIGFRNPRLRTRHGQWGDGLVLNYVRDFAWWKGKGGKKFANTLPELWRPKGIQSLACLRSIPLPFLAHPAVPSGALPASDAPILPSIFLPAFVFPRSGRAHQQQEKKGGGSKGGRHSTPPFGAAFLLPPRSSGPPLGVTPQ